jgi:hypothetical protein
MQTSPYITITGNISKFDTDDRSFTMTPTQYIVLTHTVSPFPIHGHFADSNSKKRWGADGPKVAVGSTITLGGFLQRVVRERTLDRALDFTEVEVMNIAYLSTRGNLTSSPPRTFFLALQNISSSMLAFIRKPKFYNSETLELE